MKNENCSDYAIVFLQRFIGMVNVVMEVVFENDGTRGENSLFYIWWGTASCYHQMYMSWRFEFDKFAYIKASTSAYTATRSLTNPVRLHVPTNWEVFFSGSRIIDTYPGATGRGKEIAGCVLYVWEGSIVLISRSRTRLVLLRPWQRRRLLHGHTITHNLYHTGGSFISMFWQRWPWTKISSRYSL